MSDKQLVDIRVLIERALALRSEDNEWGYDELVGEDLNDEDLSQLWLSMGYYQRAAKACLDALAEQLGRQLADRGTGVEVGGDWVMFKPRRTTRIADADGFFDWLAINPEYVRVAFNPNTARKTGIPPSVFDTFFETVESTEPFVSSVPLHILEANKQKKGVIDE